MKHIHFFGCSFTAGDELSDHLYFPWKSECKTPREYYERRNNSNIDYHKYENENKSKAYPSILGGINHALNGTSLKENMLKIIQLINSDTSVDAIYLQLPPFMRELYITDDGTIRSLRFNSLDTDVAKSYVESKISTHSDINFVVNDIMDLITFYNFMKNKNVNFELISFGYELKLRRDTLAKSSFNFLRTELDKLEMLDFTNYIISNNTRHIGGHFNIEAHQHFAQVIKQHLSDKFSISL